MRSNSPGSRPRVLMCDWERKPLSVGSSSSYRVETSSSPRVCMSKSELVIVGQSATSSKPTSQQLEATRCQPSPGWDRQAVSWLPGTEANKLKPEPSSSPEGHQVIHKQVLTSPVHGTDRANFEGRRASFDMHPGAQGRITRL
jgi:hypothetical protein